MKKRIFILTLCLFGVLCMQVKADSISYKRLDNIYFNLKVDGQTHSNYVTAFYLNNRLAYCIEPGKDITTREYESTKEWSKTDLSPSVTSFLEKVGYYGYEYPGHKTDRYYIATQELIWKAVKNVDIVWTTEKNYQGKVIDVSFEKNEILNLIKKHDEGPSFKDKIITGEVSKVMTITDFNNVLSDYHITSKNSHKLRIDGNDLIIEFGKEASPIEEVTLTRDFYDKETLLVYTKGDSQKLAALRFSSNQEVKFQIQSEEIPKIPEEPKPDEETPVIVKVPSTGISLEIEHFGIKQVIKNESHFN